MREQVRVIKNELGDSDDADEFFDRIMAANLPDEVREKLLKENERMAKGNFERIGDEAQSFLGIKYDGNKEKFEHPAKNINANTQIKYFIFFRYVTFFNQYFRRALNYRNGFTAYHIDTCHCLTRAIKRNSGKAGE